MNLGFLSIDCEKWEMLKWVEMSFMDVNGLKKLHGRPPKRNGRINPLMYKVIMCRKYDIWVNFWMEVYKILRLINILKICEGVC